MPDDETLILLHPPMTDEQLRAYEALVMEHGQGRLHNFGDDFSAADYLSGAMVLYHAIGRMGRVPPAWIYGLMAGRDPIRGEREPITVRCDHWRGDDRCAEEALVSLRSDTPPDWIAVHGVGGTRNLLRFCSRAHALRYLGRLAREDA